MTDPERGAEHSSSLPMFFFSTSDLTGKNAMVLRLPDMSAAGARNWSEAI